MRLLKWGRTQFWLFWSYFARQGRNRMVMKYSLVLAKAYLVLDNASPMAGEKCFFPVYTKTKKSLWAVCFAHICRTCLAVLVRGVCSPERTMEGVSGLLTPWTFRLCSCQSCWPHSSSHRTSLGCSGHPLPLKWEARNLLPAQLQDVSSQRGKERMYFSLNKTTSPTPCCMWKPGFSIRIWNLFMNRS